MKKLIALVLVLAAMLSVAQPALAALPDSVSPLYVHAERASILLNIDANGLATIDVSYAGSASVSNVKITTYLEKRVGGLWARVVTDQPNNEWVVSSSSVAVARSYTHQLDSAGQYRAVSVFVLTADPGETITSDDTDYYVG